MEVASGRNRGCECNQNMFYEIVKNETILSMNFNIHAYVEHYMMKIHQIALSSERKQEL